MASIVADLPETLKIRTLDDEVMEVTRKLIKESTTLMNALEIHDRPLSEEIFEVPVHSAGLKNTFKLLEFFDLDKPYNPEVDRLVCQRADHPGRMFLDRQTNKQKAEMKQAIEYLECDRLDDCLSRYISDIIRELGIFDIISEFLKIRTTDNQVIKIPRKLFEEFETLQSQVRCGNTDYEQIVYFKSSSYPKVLKVLDLCDLDTGC